MNLTYHIRLFAIMLLVAFIVFLIILWYAFLSEGAVPERAIKYIPVLKGEHQKLWPESDIKIIAGQIEAESLWKEKATRQEPSGVISYGLMQVLDITFNEMKSKHPTLLDAEATDMLQARWGIRAGILYDKKMYKLTNFAETEKDRYAFMLSWYNGGAGWGQKDRKLAEQNGVDKNIWFCSVERFSKRSPWAFKINREYPVKIFKFAEKYEGVINEP